MCMKYCKIILLVFLLVSSWYCMLSQTVSKKDASAIGVTHTSNSRSITTLDYSLNAVLWQQRSGEYKALCYQAFAVAKYRLSEKIALHRKDEMPLAIVTDIDETVLDNSPQQASDILHHRTYTEA